VARAREGVNAVGGGGERIWRFCRIQSDLWAENLGLTHQYRLRYVDGGKREREMYPEFRTTPTSSPANRGEYRVIPAIGIGKKPYRNAKRGSRDREGGEGMTNGKGAGARKRVYGYRSGSGRAGRAAGSISHGCDGSRPPKRNGISGGIP